MSDITAARPAPAGEITDDGIRALMDLFYGKVREDAELGPIFDRAIGGAWDAHLATMRDFWSSVMLTSGRYHGNPVKVHMDVEGMRPDLFARWLALFEQSCHELFDAGVAHAFMEKAARIAESLKIALFYRPDRPFPVRGAA
jgi:hemoglobin